LQSASSLKERGGVASSRKFDVFLSYAEEDEEFAEEVRTRLVRENLRVFIPSEGKEFAGRGVNARLVLLYLGSIPIKLQLKLYQ